MATKRGIRNVQGLFATMSRDLRLKTAGLPEAVYTVFEEEAENQAEDMREYIISRPSAKSGKEGRVETWKMFDAVKAEPKKHGTQLTVNVGYLDGGFEDYFFYQDNGFTHVPDGAWIEGTHALEDAYLKARLRISARLQALGLKGKAF